MLFKTLITLHQSAKNLLRRSGIDDGALHVHVGLALWFILVALTGGDVGSPWPLLGMIMIELANEILDRLRKKKWLCRETAIDFAQTIFWPLFIYNNIIRHF